jgi:hypothetical protein
MQLKVVVVGEIKMLSVLSIFAAWEWFGLAREPLLKIDHTVKIACLVKKKKNIFQYLKQPIYTS